MDGASNINGCGVDILLEVLRNIVIEQSLKFKFRASNNQVGYEVLIVGMVLPLEMSALKLKANSDSQLVANQVVKEYQEKEPQLI